PISVSVHKTACLTLVEVVVGALSGGAPGSTLFPYTTLFRSAALCSTTGVSPRGTRRRRSGRSSTRSPASTRTPVRQATARAARRSEEHTSELQSRENLVCRLLLEKKNRYIQGVVIFSAASLT